MTALTPQVAPTQNDLNQLFHLLNNQLGIILANAELLEAPPSRPRDDKLLTLDGDSVINLTE